MKLAHMLVFGSLILAGCQSPPPAGNTPPIAPNTPSVPESTSVPSSPTPSATPSASETPVATTPIKGKVKLEPLPGVKAPKLTKMVKAKFTTSQGDLLIEIYPEAAPGASKRFIELIKAGFYDNTPIFRVEPGFVCQFGINSKPGMVEWKDKMFPDDPSYFRLDEGTLAFAKAGPDTNSTQVFINYGDNSGLVSQGFTSFAKVVKGYEQTTKFKQVPEAGDQGALWTDTEGFIKKLPTKPDHIVKAEILK
ncbi:peptidylprolyl isomerase [bacterium]|nr:peptidylprolyl isomerase [bacterium]